VSIDPFSNPIPAVKLEHQLRTSVTGGRADEGFLYDFNVLIYRSCPNPVEVAEQPKCDWCASTAENLRLYLDALTKAVRWPTMRDRSTS